MNSNPFIDKRCESVRKHTKTAKRDEGRLVALHQTSEFESKPVSIRAPEAQT